MENCSGKFYVKITLLYSIVISLKYHWLPGIIHIPQWNKEKITKIITFVRPKNIPTTLLNYAHFYYILRFLF